MDFDAIVQAALEGGANVEDIAKSFTEALNKSKKELEAQKKINARQDYIDDIDSALEISILDEDVTMEDAERILFLEHVNAGEVPGDVAELTKFKEFIHKDISDLMFRWKTYNTIMKVMPKKGDLRNLDDFLNSLLH